MKTPVFLNLGIAVMMIALSTVSCGPGQGNEATDADADTTAVMETPPAAPAAPKHIMYVAHEVADYATFEKVFIEHEAMRKQNGLSVIAVMREMDNDKKVHVAVAAEDLAKAKAFAASEDLKAAMQSAGVVGAPTITFQNAEFAELVPTTSPVRILVTHRVKDYAAWKPVFDEHKAKRVEYGLTDRFVGRADGDPNMVFLSFWPADVNRAKEFMASDDLKNAMQRAGVEGAPTITFVNVTMGGNVPQ
jgi:hypothetical protein